VGMDGLVNLKGEGDPEGREVMILRHGSTVYNEKELIRGWADIPLDDQGIEEAYDLGEAMLEENVELDGIYTSDLQRSIQTSVIV